MINIRKYIKLLSVLAVVNLHGQPPVLQNYSLANPDHDPYICSTGSYFKDTAHERDQYVGIWEYNQNGTLFQLKLEEVDQHLTQSLLGYYYLDIISIKYKLVKDGVEIFSNLNDTIIPEAEGTKQSSDDYLLCLFIDYANNVQVLAHIKKLPPVPGEQPKIQFKLMTKNYTLLNPIESYQDGVDLFSVPIGPIEMVKID